MRTGIAQRVIARAVAQNRHTGANIRERLSHPLAVLYRGLAIPRRGFVLFLQHALDLVELAFDIQGHPRGDSLLFRTGRPGVQSPLEAKKPRHNGCHDSTEPSDILIWYLH
jgi:hypothetical protein